MNKSQMRELAHTARERVKDEAFHKTETGHALNLTKTREIIMDALSQYKADLLREIEGVKQKPHKHHKDCKSFHDCELFSRHEMSYNSALEDIKKKIAQ